ncbi:MAG: nucleotide exchange factor GrpE [Anaerolineae bacterium]|nr:nucleotide exchange factor GrpE [Thermoflexales bacterium]MDW8408435.1 nucleotide exchange factor GrpE [Anaerolineae bacterium]
MQPNQTDTLSEATASAGQPPAGGDAASAPATELPPVDQKDAEIEALKKQFAEADAKAKEYLDGWQRARAEFANYKKRQEADNANLRQFAIATFAAKILPVLDDFERAARTLPPTLQGLTWIDGVLLIHRKLQLILESEGIKPIEVTPNTEFDPAVHEAISHDQADGIQSGRVIEEVQKGYRLGERVIRPALVRVAK